jgi:tRNA A37 methylthiotransferase MiaB
MTARAAGRRPRTVFLCSRELGCPINLSFTTRLHNFALANGLSFRDAAAADIIIIVSCSTLPAMRRGVAAAARYYARRFPAKRVVVTGCFVTEDEVRAPNLTYLRMSQEAEFDALFGAAAPLRRAASGAPREEASELRALAGVRDAFDRPYNVMVSTGCLNHCAFCIQKSIFPKVQSVPLARVVAACREGLRQGYRNLVLGGSDIASYGRDLDCDVTDLFAALFSQALMGQPDAVLGFKGLEPSGFIRHFPKLRKYFATGRIGWICLPIQSGSDRVLRSMDRRYRAADVIRVIKELRRAAPRLRIDTDILFCYPTETKADFAASLRILERFDHVQALMFQRHRGTKAFALKDVFSAAEKARRRRVMRAVEKRSTASRRPECRLRTAVRLPSPLGASGFSTLATPAPTRARRNVDLRKARLEVG